MTQQNIFVGCGIDGKVYRLNLSVVSGSPPDELFNRIALAIGKEMEPEVDKAHVEVNMQAVNDALAVALREGGGCS